MDHWASTRTWEPLRPLGGAADSVPSFPLEVLPPWLRIWALWVSNSLQCPTDLPAVLGLAVLAVAWAKKFAVRAKEDHLEPLNLFAAVVLGPGESKTPAFEKATRVLREWEVEEALRTAPQIAAGKAIRGACEERQRALQKAVGREENPDKRAELEVELLEETRRLNSLTVPRPLRLLAEDCTPEALAQLLAANDGRLAVMSDEGGLLANFGGRYSNGQPNLDLLLKSHTGASSWRDRVGGGQCLIRDPQLTVALTLQPFLLEDDRFAAVFRGRGLHARFLYCYPTSLVGYRNSDAPAVPTSVQAAYEREIRVALGVELAREKDGNPTARELALSPPALSAWRDFKARLEPQLRIGGRLHAIADWVNKLPGQVLRLAGLLSLGQAIPLPDAQHPCGISVGTMNSAVRLGLYFLEHALTTFEKIDGDPQVAKAHRIRRWIVEQGSTGFTKRAAHQALRGHSWFKKAEMLDEPLAHLQAANIIRRVPEARREGVGRSASPSFEVNPEVLRSGPHNPQNPQKPSSEDCENPEDVGSVGRADHHCGAPPIGWTLEEWAEEREERRSIQEEPRVFADPKANAEVEEVPF